MFDYKQDNEAIDLVFEELSEKSEENLTGFYQLRKGLIRVFGADAARLLELVRSQCAIKNRLTVELGINFVSRETGLSEKKQRRLFKMLDSTGALCFEPGNQLAMRKFTYNPDKLQAFIRQNAVRLSEESRKGGRRVFGMSPLTGTRHGEANEDREFELHIIEETTFSSAENPSYDYLPGCPSGQPSENSCEYDSNCVAHLDKVRVEKDEADRGALQMKRGARPAEDPALPEARGALQKTKGARHMDRTPCVRQ